MQTTSKGFKPKMQTQTPIRQGSQLAKHERLISFEPSHAWIKRFDSEGAKIIQAGWKVNPTGRFHRDSENPYVIFNGTHKLYGSRVCEGDHISPLHQRKENLARDYFAATLRPSDHTKDLIVVVSHWDEDTANAIAQSLMGAYDVTVNGERIQCNVIKAIPELEGRGAYYLVKPQLKPGKTLLIEAGHGTSEEWIVSSDGIFDGKVTENLAVSRLVDMIAGDQRVRSHCLKLGEQEINRELIAKGLRTGQFGSMPVEHWEAIKQHYVATWFDSLKNYLLKAYGSELQSISNILLSGGGSALIRDRAKGFAIIPDTPETASVRGSFLYHTAVLGA